MKTHLRIFIASALALLALPLVAQQKSDLTTLMFSCNFDGPSAETKVLKNLPYEKGVKDLSLDLEQNLLIISYKAGKNSPDNLKKAVEKLGYATQFLGEAHLFGVNGKCGMCETKIENTAMALAGVSAAHWDMDLKRMTVAFDASKIDLEAIHAAIAGVGYDTDRVKASDEAYENLHHCCHYER